MTEGGGSRNNACIVEARPRPSIGDAAAGFSLEARGRLVKRVARIVIRKRPEDDAQRMRFVAHRWRAGRKRALARGAAPELHDFELLLARAAARKIAAAAMRAGLRLFGRKGNARGLRNRCHTSTCAPYHKLAEKRGSGT